MENQEVQLSDGEIELINWQYRRQGSFKQALWSAIAHADQSNLALLYMGFPDEVNAYYRFSQESGYWEDVLKRAVKCGYLEKEQADGID